MICDRYWREGIVLVERGLDDPHRDGCADCVRAHASRRELVEALPLIGAGYTGDPHWQANVWRRIDGDRADVPWHRRWRWPLNGALVVACAVALWLGLLRPRSDRADVARSPVEIIAGGVAMRSSSANVDDRLRVTVGETSEVWIYRAERLVLQCRARQASDNCTPNSHGMVVDMVLSIPGAYQVIVVKAPVTQPQGRLDADRAALESARVDYSDDAVSVR